MYPPYKLARLPVGQRRRKLALLLASVERLLAGDSSPGARCDGFDAEYLRELVRLALADESLDSAARADVESLLSGPSDAPSLLRLCNHARHALLAAIGTFPAEWDLVRGDRTGGGSGDQPIPAELVRDTAPMRAFFPGVSVYAEDIRSPFNLGSIFRTAEAFGAERVFVSPLCVPPSHPRAQRSAMGCIDYLPWERRSLDELPPDLPIFALETGGIDIAEFDFPDRGVVIIGSEELGISPEGLSRAKFGRVSIPMTGIKASLNVGVAFGILMQAWTLYLACSAEKPS